MSSAEVMALRCAGCGEGWPTLTFKNVYFPEPGVAWHFNCWIVQNPPSPVPSGNVWETPDDLDV